MSHATAPPPHRASPTGPAPDRDAPALPNLARLLHVVQILLAYGRHLADTFERRAAAPGFHLLARAFGTSNPAVILAHIRRGILRAAALERILLARAASGRDIARPPMRVRLKRDAAQAEANPAATPPEAPPSARKPPRPAWRDDWLDGVADPLDFRHLPSLEALEAQMRRRPLGRNIGDICADLGIAPVLCLGAFWNELFFAMLHHDGSPATYDLRRWRREQQFVQEQDRRPTLDLSWPEVDLGGGRGDTLLVLGFFIGEQPAEPAIIAPQQRAPGTPGASAAPAAPRPQHPTPHASTAAPAATGPP